MKIKIVTSMSLAALLTGAFSLAACDRTESSSKTTSTKVVDTPEGKKKVTETTEKTTTKDEKR